MKLLVLVLLLTGCAIKYPTAPATHTHTVSLDMIGKSEACKTAWNNSIRYLAGVGIQVRQGQLDSQTIACLGRLPLLYKFLNPFYVGGAADPENGSAFVYTDGSKKDTQVMLHEIGHLLGASHTLTGTMVFDYHAMSLSTGYSEFTLREIRENSSS